MTPSAVPGSPPTSKTAARWRRRARWRRMPPPRATQRYDQREERIALDEVVKINIRV